MEENYERTHPTPKRRRRKRSKWQIFKESYLPVIIAVIAVILIISFIAGSVSRSRADDNEADPDSSSGSSDSQNTLESERQTLLTLAEKKAAQYDYESAMTILYSYSAGMDSDKELSEKYAQYSAAKDALVLYEDMEHIPNLSFNLLIEDLDRALADATYGSSGNNAYRKNYITTDEFRAILDQLYTNNYILVSLYDVASATTDEAGNTIMSYNALYLPEGKTPIILTELGANYFTYMVDSDSDGLADAGGDGFASKLVVNNGNLVNEMVDTDGNTITGAFDLITILEEFVAEHPDFSYKGAKAVIAVTGYDGLFGYRTDPETALKISQEYYDSEVAGVAEVIAAVKAAGFDIACYTYDMSKYSNMTEDEIKADLELWEDEVTPLLGDVDILVYPGSYDIGTEDAYTGGKYSVLRDFGFKYYVRQDNSNASWSQLTDEYYRLSRLWITGSALETNAGVLADFFDAAAVLNPAS